MRHINKLILHCAATREGQDIKAATIKKWHMEQNKWKDIGYHYVIDLDGTIEKGRNVEETGAHCYGENKYSIGICYVGGVDKSGKPKDTRTEAQKKSMCQLVLELMKKYKLDIDDVYCHNQFAAKACPSFSIEQFRKEFAMSLCE